MRVKLQHYQNEYVKTPRAEIVSMRISLLRPLTNMSVYYMDLQSYLIIIAR